MDIDPRKEKQNRSVLDVLNDQSEIPFIQVRSLFSLRVIRLLSAGKTFQSEVPSMSLESEE